MANELIPQDIALPSKYGQEDQFKKLATSGGFLPYVLLYQSGSNAVKKRQIQQGNFGLVQNQQIVDLGDQFDCAVLSWRPKALRMAGDDTKAWYNPAHPEFIKCEAESKIKNSGCACGAEYLIYIPEIEQYAGFLFGNPTLKRAAPDMKALLRQAATIRSVLIEKKTYSWFGPVITACTNPFSIDQEEAKAQITKFNTPPEEQAEKVDEAEPARER